MIDEELKLRIGLLIGLFNNNLANNIIDAPKQSLSATNLLRII